MKLENGHGLAVLEQAQVPDFDEAVVAAADQKRLAAIPVDHVDVARVRRLAREHVGAIGWRAHVEHAYALVRGAGGEDGRLVGRPLDVLDAGRVADERPLVDEPRGLVGPPHVNVLAAVAGGQLAGDERRPVEREALVEMASELEDGRVSAVAQPHELAHGLGVVERLQCARQIPDVHAAQLRPGGREVRLLHFCTLHASQSHIGH